jgi:hypothetical protein
VAVEFLDLPVRKGVVAEGVEVVVADEKSVELKELRQQVMHS